MRKYTHDEWVTVLGDEYDAVDAYRTSLTPIFVKHKSCGHEFKVTPHNFFRGSRCPKCAIRKRGNARRKSHEQFTREFQEKFKYSGEYTFLTKYTIDKDPIKVHHNVCNAEYTTTPNNLISGKKCPYCYGTPKLTQEIWKERLSTKQCVSLSPYIDANTKTKIKNLHCGHEYLITPSNFYKPERGCPICKESRGEYTIRELLEILNVPYIQEYTFNDCISSSNKKRNYLCKFDFAITNNNGTILGVIEYDGEHHYMDIPGWAPCSEYQKNDKHKNEYLKQKNIPLLRIPYFNKQNISSIVEEFIMFLQQEVISYDE